MNRLRTGLAFASLVLALFVLAASRTFARNWTTREPRRLDSATMKAWGGPYAVDCRAPASPTLRIASDGLSLHTGPTRTTGHDLRAVPAFFGGSPPPNYQVALTSELTGGARLTFVVYRDEIGPYVKLEGDAKLHKRLGEGLFTRTFRSCDPDKNRAP